MPSFIPATGRTQHVAAVWLNRIGKEPTKMFLHYFHSWGIKIILYLGKHEAQEISMPSIGHVIMDPLAIGLKELLYPIIIVECVH
jgi:hypothetical protein